jgi:glycosyltransferase involved in cell wall biosynthesis
MLAERFAAEGNRVVLLTAAVDGQPSHEERNGYEIIRRGGELTVYLFGLAWTLSHRRQISSIIDSQNGIPFFSPLAVSPRTPVVLLLHHIHQDQFAKYLPRPAAAAGRWLERTGTRVVYGRRAIVAVSPSTRQGARRRLGLRGEIQVVPPGCDPMPDRLRLGLDRSPHRRIVCVGRLVPHKRMHLLIEAMPALAERYPDLDLQVVGDGTEIDDLRARVARFGLEDRVTLHGSLSQEDRDQLLATAWMTVNPSQGEGWGLSIVEANALGVPALAYRRPGLRDSIRDGVTGWLIDDRQDLAEAIGAALDQLADPGLAMEMSQRAHHWVSRFTWDEMAAQIGDVLDGERGRLSHGSDDRRVRTDLATVVHIPTRLLPSGWTPDFRLTDKWTHTNQALVVLLSGADTRTARQALRRSGLPDEVADDPAVGIEVARPTDFLSPIPNAPTPLTERADPVGRALTR